MPASKISCNSFYMFMMELKKNEEQRGRRCTLQSIEPEASRRWQKLPAELKQVYKTRAREYRTSQEFQNKKREAKSRPHRTRAKAKINRRGNDGLETTSSDSDTDDEIFFDPDEEEKFMRRRDETRSKFKTALTWNLGADVANKIMDYSFYVVAVQCYYESVDHEYMPAEISVVEFSLKQGIMTQFDTILKPVHIPEHSRTAIVTKAGQTHQISITQPTDEYRDDYRNVINEIKSFSICKQQNQFRAFALAKQYNAVQGTAKILRTKTSSRSFLPADKILCVEDLYVLLCQLKGVNPKRAYVNLFNQVLTETDFDFEPHTLCIYHNRRQSKFCALGLARKACYFLFELLQDVYGFTMTSNHIPPMASNMRFNRPNLSLQSNQFEDYVFAEQHSSSIIPQLTVDRSTLCEPQRMNNQNIHQSTMSMSMLSSSSAHPPNYVCTDILAECAIYDRSQRQTHENFNGGVPSSSGAGNGDQNRSTADPTLTMFPRMPKIQAAALSMPRYESFFPMAENSAAGAMVNRATTIDDRRNSPVSPYTMAEQSRMAAVQNFPSSSIRNASDGSQNGGDFVQRFRNLGIHFNTQIR